MKKIITTTLFFLFFVFNIYSQNCSINAGIDLTRCANDIVQVTAFTAGPLNGTPNIQWTQVSGTSVNIITATSLTTFIRNFPRAGGTFRFACGVNCGVGGRVYDTITITILATPNKPSAGRDTTFCPGTKQLNASSAGSGEVGQWTEFWPSYFWNGMWNSALPNTNINSFDYGSSTNYRWEVRNTTTGCKDADSVYIIFCGGGTVNAGPDRTLDACYVSPPTSFQKGVSFSINGAVPSNMGRNCGQSGLWTNVSRPAGAPVPTFNNPSDNYYNTIGNLYPGTYRFAWTVSGNCASGSDTVTITVPNPLGMARPIGSTQQYYLCGQTSTTLPGPTLLPGQTFSGWSKLQGPAGDSIGNSASTSTTVHKLKLPNSNQQANSWPYPYIYTYTVTAGTCVGGTSYVYIYPERPPSLDITPLQVNLPCLSTTATIPFKYKNMGFGFSISRVSGPTSFAAYTTQIDTINGNINLYNLTPGTYVLRINSTQAGCAQYVSDMVTVYVSATPSLSNAGSNQRLQCNVDSTNLVGNIPSSGTGIWSQMGGPSAVSFIPNVYNNQIKLKNLVAGSYQLRWTIDGGTCPSNFKDVFVFVASSPPSYVEAGSNRSVCYGSPLKLKGNKPKDNEIGTWSVSPSGPTFSNVNDSTATISNLAASTTYKVFWRIFNACATITDSLTITTSASQGPAAASAGADQCLTSGTTSVTLTGNAPTPSGVTGIWRKVGSFTGTISSPTSNSTTVTGLSNGNYRFSWNLQISGCDSTSDTIDITINQAAIAGNAGKDTSICANTLNLYAKKPAIGIGNWQQISGPNYPTIANIYDSTSNISNMVVGTYLMRWWSKNDVCPAAFDDIAIQVSNPPSTAKAMRDTIICGSNISYNYIPLKATRPTMGQGRWQFLSGPSQQYFSPDTSNTPQPLYLYQSGTYKFLWTVSTPGNCPMSVDTVTINSVLKPNAGADLLLCNQNSAILTGNYGSSGTWVQIGNTPSVVTLVPINAWSASISGLTTGTYTFSFTLSSGSCTLRDTLNITVSTPISPFNIGNDTAICLKDTNTFVLNGPAAGSGVKAQWTVLSCPFGYSSQFLGRTDTLSTAYMLNANIHGNYLVRYRLSKGGCAAEDIKQITINSGFAFTTIKDTGRCSGNDTFHFSGSTKANTAYNWSKLNGNGSNPLYTNTANTQVTITTAQNFGRYLYKMKDTLTRCIAKDTVMAVNSASPIGYATPSVQTICGNSYPNYIQFLTQNNVPNTTYTWTRNNNTNVTGIPANGSGTGIGGYSASNTTGIIQTVIFTVQCRTLAPSNCSGNTFYDTLIVRPNTNYNLNLKIDTIIKCVGEPYTINWKKNNAFTTYCLSSDEYCNGNVYYTGTDSFYKSYAIDQGYGTQFYLYAVDSNNCYYSEYTYYKEDYSPAVPKLDAKNPNLCKNDSAIIFDANGNQGYYTFSSKPWGTGKIYQDSLKYSEFMYHPDTADAVKYIYVKLYYGKGCPGIDSFPITIFPNPKHTLTVDNDTVCYGNDFTFTAHPSNDSTLNPEFWIEDNYWLTGNIIIKAINDTIGTVNSADVISQTGKPLGSQFEVHSWLMDYNTGCADTATTRIAIAEVPTCFAGSDVPTMNTWDSTQLGGSPTGSCGTCMGSLKYVWNPTDSVSGIYIANPFTTTDLPLTYYVTVSDSISGCNCTDDISILSVLPVKWLQFTAEWQKENGYLEWLTAMESNNNGYAIQRSFDGINFTDIGFVASQTLQNPHGPYNYKYLDASKELKEHLIVYYRLKQIYYNGDYGYSKIAILTNMDKKPLGFIHVKPNPANSQLQIALVAPKGSISLNLINAEGKTVLNETFNTTQGVNYIELNQLENHASGIYQLVITDKNGHTETVKVVLTGK